MQAKDIPNEPVLEFLAGLDRWATIFPGYDNSVQKAMPEGTPEKVARAKMYALIRRGWVDGCVCGCRGDFEITNAGRETLSH
jgi:hypothetical protein